MALLCETKILNMHVWHHEHDWKVKDNIAVKEFDWCEIYVSDVVSIGCMATRRGLESTIVTGVMVTKGIVSHPWNIIIDPVLRP